MREIMTKQKKETSMKRNNLIKKFFLYLILLIITAAMLIPFIWMLSASIKTDREVFQMTPFVLIPETPRWSNYVDIWTKIPFGTFVKNTVFLTIVVTALQLLTSSFAAYSFAKLEFKHKNALFMAYIATIAMPWQVYMVPQFILVSKMGLNDTHIGLMLMQAFSAFGVFLMRQFYISIPDELCEAARIDGLNEFGIFSKIIFPLGKPGMATLTIFTFTNVWNDFMGPLIYLKTQELKTVQLGIRMFISQYGADYAWIMAASVCSLIPVVIVFLSCQRFFVEGVAASGIKG